MSFDLAKKYTPEADADEGYILQLCNPYELSDEADPLSGTPIEAFIELAGPGGKIAKAAAAKMLKDERENENKWRKKLGKKKDEAITIDDLDENQVVERANAAEKLQVDFFARLTLGWSGVTKDGKNVPFTKENAIEFYTEAKWVVEQLGAFFRKSKATKNRTAKKPLKQDTLLDG